MLGEGPRRPRALRPSSESAAKPTRLRGSLEPRDNAAIPPNRDPHPQRSPTALVATNGPRTVGGLSAYARHIGRELRQYGRVDDVIRFPVRARPSTDYVAFRGVGEHAEGSEIAFGPDPRVVRALGLVTPAMRRALTRPAAKAMHGWGIRRALRHAILPDVGHVHWIGTGWELTGFEARREAARRRVPFTVLPAIHPGTWGDSAFDFMLYRAADAVFAMSEHERRLLIRGGVPEDRVHVAGLAPAALTDGDARRFRADYGLRDAPIVLFIGRRAEYKGAGVLHGAMEAVWRRHTNCRLVLCGPDDEQRTAACDPRILDLGSVSERIKADVLAAADVFCMPSLFESFGIAYVEAWSYGVPVVGGPAPAVRELIRDGVDGLLVDQTPHSIARALMRLLEDADLRHRMGAAGRERQRESFTWACVARRHETVVATLRGGRR